MPQGTLLKLVFSTPPIGQKTFPLVRNQELEVDDGIESSPKDVPLVDTPVDDTLFE